MIVSLPKLQIASLVITVLASATLSYGLYHKAGSVSSCHGRLAQLHLLDTQLDARKPSSTPPRPNSKASSDRRKPCP